MAVRRTIYEIEVINDDLWFSMIVSIVSGSSTWRSPKIPLLSLTRPEAITEAESKGRAVANSMGGVYKSGGNSSQMASSS